MKKVKENIDLLKYEKEWYEKGITLIGGVDEVGRGALAGPVVAAAVILKKEAKYKIPEVYDSKKFSQKKREIIYKKILDVTLDFGLGAVSAKIIDEMNILNATMLAMKYAVENLRLSPKVVLIDGNKMPDISSKSFCIIKGDTKSASIAAASIVAKVTRDFMMKKLGERYVNYIFEKNKGYATKEHFEKILKFGITNQHRKSFLKKFEDKKFKIQNISGKIVEKICYGWLKKNGYSVICKNYKYMYGEIDLIATKERYIYFIEVKLRRYGCGYMPCECVDLKKQKKILKTAYLFIKNHPNKYQPKFSVAEIFRKNFVEFELNFIDNAFFVNNEYNLFN